MKSRVKVLGLIKENSAITIPEIAQILGLSIKGVEKIIRILKQEDNLRRIGTDKVGHWEAPLSSSGTEGAGVVVTKNVSGWIIVVGVTTRVIKTRTALYDYAFL